MFSLVHPEGLGATDWDLLPQFSHLTSQHVFKLFADSEVDEKVSAGIHHDEELAESQEDVVPFRNLGTVILVHLELVSEMIEIIF